MGFSSPLYSSEYRLPRSAAVAFFPGAPENFPAAAAPAIEELGSTPNFHALAQYSHSREQRHTQKIMKIIIE